MRKLLSLLALLLVLATLAGCTVTWNPGDIPGGAVSDTDGQDHASQGNGTGDGPDDGPGENPDDNSGTPDGGSVRTLTVTYDFSSATGTGTELTAQSALSLFVGCADRSDAELLSVGVTKVYDGAGQGGARPGATGLLKTGSSSSNGRLILTYAGGFLVTKVELVCHDFYARSEGKTENSNTVSVNGSAGVLAPFNESGEGETLTFMLPTPSSVLTVESGKRIYLYQMTVFIEVTEVGSGTGPATGDGSGATDGSDTGTGDGSGAAGGSDIGTGDGSGTAGGSDAGDSDFEDYGMPVITVDLSAVEVEESGVYTSMKEVGAYIYRFGHLPSNFVLDKTRPKNEYTSQNKISAGGTTFYNNEGNLPASFNGTYIECDIDYTGGSRNAKRIVYSTKGPIFYTSNHYKSFSILRFVFGSDGDPQTEETALSLSSDCPVAILTLGGVYGSSPRKVFCLPVFWEKTV